MDLWKTPSDAWHDFSMDKITIDYDNIIVNLSDEGEVIIKCCEYIFFSSVSHWDENILKAISIDENAPIIKKTLGTIKQRYGEDYMGGGTKKISDQYCCIRFEFLDDNIFEVICKSHEILQ